jgi:hypothetical protein
MMQIKTRNVGGILFSVGFFILMNLFMGYIFGFSVKNTKEYACTLERVKRSPLVLRELGEPIEAGRIAWLYSRESGGGRAETSFGTSVSGPYGSSRIRANSYLAPVGSYLLVQYRSEEGWLDVYNGDYPCR